MREVLATAEAGVVRSRGAGGKRALFIDWGGTLAFARDHRTVVDADGNRVLMPNVAATLAHERPRFELCFIASNQGRIARGEISAAEVVRRFAWTSARLGGPFTDWRLCPHVDADGCECRKPRTGCSSSRPASTTWIWGLPSTSATRRRIARRPRGPGVGRFVWARDFFGWGPSPREASEGSSASGEV